ncbi:MULTISPECIES: hypothetical protein [unclassified Clostridium]|uniref:hypothetical protein n=1 Tax=unclassified Clostridium TaxID=2614128 RepID=UPI00290E79DB|nr:hypothetical protein [Clostridium sp.]MDU5106713.1 hypothetical protein [Clostridium sp.]
MVENLIVNQKRKILDHINYAKERNLNKISALIVCDNEEIQKELLTWLIFHGYKVSLTKDEVSVLVIEW